MAVTTLDTAIAGLKPPETFIKAAGTAEAAGVYWTPFYTTGRPGAAAAPAPGINGAALTTYAGQVPFPAAVGGTNIYLAGLSISQATAAVGEVVVIDRMWHNSGLVVTTTTAQAITPVAIPARDNTGTTNGEGVLAAIEVVTATTNAGAIANMTISYTNQAGTAGKTGTVASFPATAAAGSFIEVSLAAGDTGVRSVQSVTLGTSLVTGSVSLVLYRRVASAALPIFAAAAVDRDMVQLGMPRMYDNSVPQLLYLPNISVLGATSGRLVYTQG